MATKTPLPDREPVRLGGWIGIAAGAVLAWVGAVFAMDIEPVKAVGMIALQLVGTIPGLEWARGTFSDRDKGAAWAPESVRDVFVGYRPPPQPWEIPDDEAHVDADDALASGI